MFPKVHTKVAPFWKIWLLHVLVYYPIIGVQFVLTRHKDENTVTVKKIVSTIFISPLMSMYGLFEEFPVPILAQIILMFIINLKIKSTFYSYVLTLVLSNLLFYYLNYSRYRLGCPYNIPLSVLFIIVVHWLVFGGFEWFRLKVKNRFDNLKAKL